MARLDGVGFTCPKSPRETFAAVLFLPTWRVSLDRGVGFESHEMEQSYPQKLQGCENCAHLGKLRVRSKQTRQCLLLLWMLFPELLVCCKHTMKEKAIPYLWLPKSKKQPTSTGPRSRPLDLTGLLANLTSSRSCFRLGACAQDTSDIPQKRIVRAPMYNRLGKRHWSNYVAARELRHVNQSVEDVIGSFVCSPTS